MVSGLFSAKTEAHFSTVAATDSRGHAAAVCTERLAVNTSTTPLIPRRVCISCLPQFCSSLTDQATPNVPVQLFFSRYSSTRLWKCWWEVPTAAGALHAPEPRG